MARILQQTFVNIGAGVADEDEARIAFTHANMINGYAITVSAVYLIARTAAFVYLLIAIFVRRAVAVGKALYFEAS